MLTIFLPFYKVKQSDDSIKSKINAFLQKNPDAFDEFSPVQEAGIEAIRKLGNKR